VTVFVPTNLAGAFVVEPERIVDERGWFARMYCQREFQEHGIDFVPIQASVSYNTRRGTIRGMHYQDEPFAETKLVRCTRGSLYDVIVDLRPEQPTFRRWFGVELNAENHLALLVPPGVAHGLQTLEDDTEVTYQITPAYSPAHARGVRWDDPAFQIEWPFQVVVISARDSAYAAFQS